MKTLFRIMTLFLTLFCFAGCDDDEEVLATLDVTAANLDGTWKLVEWNGAPLQEGSYCYITFSRKDKTYKMYQVLRMRTLSFTLLRPALMNVLSRYMTGKLLPAFGRPGCRPFCPGFAFH